MARRNFKRSVIDAHILCIPCHAEKTKTAVFGLYSAFHGATP